MKKLTHINKIYTFFLITFALIVGISLYGVLSMKVEKSMHISISNNEYSSHDLTVDASYVYKIRKGFPITIRIENNYYQLTVSKMEIKDNKLHISVNNFPQEIYSGTTIDAEIIYDKETLLSSLID